MIQISDLWKHQQETAALRARSDIVADFSDPGTGKTRAHLYAHAVDTKRSGRLLVLCPKTLMDSAWGDELDSVDFGMSYMLGYAENWETAIAAKSDVFITNIDGVKRLAKMPSKWFKNFSGLVIDECFPAGTLVDTPNGPTPIEVLKVGDPVYTSDGTLPITRTSQRPSSALMRLELEDGRTIVCTEEHPFATEAGWRQARFIGNLRLVQLDLRQLDQSRATLLQPQLQSESDVELDAETSARTHATTNVCGQERQAILEQGYPLSAGNTTQAQLGAQAQRTPAEDSRWQRQDGASRARSAQDAAEDLGIQLAHPYWQKAWDWLSKLLQGRFRQRTKAHRSGDRRGIAHSAKKLGCQERFFADFVRVARSSRIECRDPVTVFNLQVDGPHNYSVAGVLVHNSTKLKHRTSDRSKAAAQIANHFAERVIMTGTPNPNSVTELWHQILLLDGGARLGKNFWKFRAATQIPEQVGPRPEHLKWMDKPGIEETVFYLLRDIVIRHPFSVMKVPKNYVRRVKYHLPKKLMAQYLEMEDSALLQLEDKDITSVHAAALRQKLLQIASGAVYHDREGGWTMLDKGRYELVLDLVEERRHSLTFFMWHHQKECLVAEAQKRGLSFAVIDGTVSPKKRHQIKNEFQDGKYQTLFLHPETGSHGLTLTRATSAILTSPTYKADDFEQMIKRIQRGGQTKKTEMLCIEGVGTCESGVYTRTEGKRERMDDFRNLLVDARSGRG